MRRCCGRCGAPSPFDRFRLAERCPRCGYQFAREEGFFAGVWFINYSITTIVLLPLIFGWIVWSAASDGDAPLWPLVVTSVALAVVLPVLAYRRSATTWAAIDLALRPLEPTEEAEAALHENLRR